MWFFPFKPHDGIGLAYRRWNDGPVEDEEMELLGGDRSQNWEGIAGSPV